jgi:hypothetical protein
MDRAELFARYPNATRRRLLERELTVSLRARCSLYAPFVIRGWADAVLSRPFAHDNAPPLDVLFATIRLESDWKRFSGAERGDEEGQGIAQIVVPDGETADIFSLRTSARIATRMLHRASDEPWSSVLSRYRAGPNGGQRPTYVSAVHRHLPWAREAIREVRAPPITWPSRWSASGHGFEYVTPTRTNVEPAPALIALESRLVSAGYVSWGLRSRSSRVPSEHTEGRALDIAGGYQLPLLQWLLSMRRELRLVYAVHRQLDVIATGGRIVFRNTSRSDHDDHLHVGFHPSVHEVDPGRYIAALARRIPLPWT